MPALHAGASRDPVVGGIEPSLEVAIGYDVGRRVVADPNDLDAANRHLRLTGRLALYLNNLPALVRTAVGARKVRPFRLMALRTLDGRDTAQLPVGGTTAARLAAGCLPF